MAEGSGPQGNNVQIYNIVTAVVLALTLILCLAIVLMAITWPRAVGQTVVEPTLFGFPTFTPRPDEPTPVASFTATLESGNDSSAPPAAEVTLTPTSTTVAARTPTATPTQTETPTATLTLTPTETLVPTNTKVPTATNTRLPFDYVLRNGLIAFSKSETWITGSGCDWQGVAGVIYDLKGQHQTGFLIHLWKSGDIDTRVSAGSETRYGASGWEIKISSALNDNAYNVQLEDPQKKAVSDVVVVDFNDSCDSNHAFLTFDQKQ